MARSRSRVGPYSRHGAIAVLDGRSREALFMKRRRAALVAHVGGNPSAVQAALIERAVRLSLHLELMDAKIASGVFSERDSRQYLAWSNSLARALQGLGVKPAAQKAPTLAELLARPAPAPAVPATPEAPACA